MIQEHLYITQNLNKLLMHICAIKNFLIFGNIVSDQFVSETEIIKKQIWFY